MAVEVADFNSRPSARGDCPPSSFLRRSTISIHAPPRGATTAACSRNLRLIHFNSRPSARGDTAGSIARFSLLFQFTPLREGRPRKNRAILQAQDFNSRPSARGDTLRRAFLFFPFVFQFTPLREGRPLGISLVSGIITFQFTPLREGRRNCELKRKEFSHISIHAPPRGATRGDLEAAFSVFISIHAPPRGATSAFPERRILQHFNSRPSARGDGCSGAGGAGLPQFQFTPLREGRRICK